MAQKEQIGVTKDRAKYRCPPELEELIDVVNLIDEFADEIPDMVTEDSYDFYYNNSRGLCNGVHQLAQMAGLPVDWREDYAKSVVGTPDEWDRFCRDLSTCLGAQVKLWRRWPAVDSRDDFWDWPRITISLMIGEDWRVSAPSQIIATALIDIDVRRLRECRVCWRIFWATRLEKTGGPYGCSPKCNSTLRQREFKASKKS